MKYFTVLASLVAASVLLQAKEGTTVLRVPGMNCDACTVVIKKALTQTKGVKNVDKRTATVVYEDTQVTQAEIEKTIEKAGFKAEQAK